MTNTEFINRALNIAQNHSTCYVSGGFGAPLSGTLGNKMLQRYTTNNAYNVKHAQKIRQKVASQSAPVFGFDCCGVIKAILWGWKGDENNNYGGSVYASNGLKDINQNGMRQMSQTSTDFSNIVPGSLVYLPGHVGVYVGEGKVVESTPAWGNMVQITGLRQHNVKVNGKWRNWDCWGKFPLIDYEEMYEMAMSRQELKDLIRETMAEVEAEKAKKITSSWSMDAQIECIHAEIMQPTTYPNGDRKDLIDRPQSYATREEVAVMLDQMLKVIEAHKDGEKVRKGRKPNALERKDN